MKVSKEQVAHHKKQILAAAARLFRQRGFSDVTVAEIMKEADLTHGAFYGYFRSKEALIAAAIGVGGIAVRRAGPRPGRGAGCAVLPCLLDSQPLGLRLLVDHDQVHVVAAAEAVVGHREQAVGVGWQVDARHGALFESTTSMRPGPWWLKPL